MEGPGGPEPVAEHPGSPGMRPLEGPGDPAARQSRAWVQLHAHGTPRPRWGTGMEHAWGWVPRQGGQQEQPAVPWARGRPGQPAGTGGPRWHWRLHGREGSVWEGSLWTPACGRQEPQCV